MSSATDRQQDEEPATVGLSDKLDLHLSFVFCGLNPALSAVRDGHNFSSSSNRFWKVLYLSAFTPHLLRPEEERELLQIRMRHYRCCLPPNQECR